MDYNAILNLLKGKNIGALKGILTNDDSRRALSQVLSEGDAKKALSDAQNGDTRAAQILLERLVATPDGKALIARLLTSLGGSANG